MNKILKVVFLLLLLVLLGELGYYFYSFYGIKIGSKEKAISNVTTIAPSKNLTSTPSEIVSDPAEAVSRSVKNFFKDGQTGSLAGLDLTYTYIGTLDKLEFKKQKIPIDKNLNPTFTPSDVDGLIVIRTKDDKVREFYYYEQELAKISFYEKKDDKLSTINRGDLKSGDAITFIQTINLLKPPNNNLIEVKIIKD